MLGFLIYKMLSSLAAILPLRIAYLIADCISLVSFAVCRSRTRNLMSNLAIALQASRQEPDKQKISRLALAATINFGRAVVDTLKIQDVEKIKNRFEIRGIENLDAALAKGRGAVVATAHLGSWEIGGALLSRMGYRIASVAGQQFNALLSRFVIQSKTKSGIMVFSAKQIFSIFRELRRGAIVVLHIDGDQFFGGVPARFFNREVMMPRGPAALARACGSPLLCAVSIRRKNKIEIVFGEEIPTDGRTDLEITQSIVNVIESKIARNLDQWLMFRRIWKE